MKTFKFSLVLRTRENTDVFITLDDNIYGIHSKRVNILYVYRGRNVYDSMCIEQRLRSACAFAQSELRNRIRVFAGHSVNPYIKI